MKTLAQEAIVEQNGTIDLQSRFNKSVLACCLRDILTQHGIPQNEAVIVKIQQPDGTDIVETEVPTSNKTILASKSSDFRGDVIEFLNRADAMFEFVSKLPPSKVSTIYMNGNVEQTESMYKITFECGKMSSILTGGEPPVAMKESPLAIIIVPFDICKPCGPRPCCSK